MKNMYKYLLTIVVLTMTGVACQDWLDIKPLDNLVEEDFWQTYGDVESSINATYKVMVGDAIMERIIIGSELRSDNVDKQKMGTQIAAAWQNIMMLRNKDDNAYSKWNSFYTLINYCNRILKFAPEVAKKDPNYTLGREHMHEAEAYAIRAWAYFYLVRLYGDVPYIDFPYLDDTQPTDYPNCVSKDAPFGEYGTMILDSMLVQLETAERYAPLTHGYTVYTPNLGTSSYISSIRRQTKGRITKNAVRALIADIALWQASMTTDETKRQAYYQTCIDACDRVMPFILSDEDWRLNQQFTGAELKLVQNENADYSGNGWGDYYQQVFYTGNSDESIFELQFDNSNTSSTVRSIYGDNSTQHIYATKNSAGAYAYPNDDIRKNTNSYQMSSQDNTWRILKYVVMRMSTTVSGTNTSVTASFANSSRNFDWIIYRVPDIYLMKAEALAERSERYGDAAAQQEALDLVNKVYARADVKNKELKLTGSISKLVLDERRREFMFEGKRWFDLLRYMRKSENARTEALNMLKGDYSSEISDLIESKLKSPGAIYLPIHKDEIDANPNLHANPYKGFDSKK